MINHVYKPKWFSQRLLSFVAIAFLLAACSSAPKRVDTVEPVQLVDNSQLQQILNLANAGEFDNARLQLQLLPLTQLSQSDLYRYYITAAAVDLKLEFAASGLAHLDQLRDEYNQLPTEIQRRYSLIRADLLELQQEYLAAVRERVFVAPLLTCNMQQLNHEKIWSSLLQIPVTKLQQFASIETATDLDGWFQLAAIAVDPELSIDDHIAAVTAWQLMWPNHAAAINLPGSLSLLSELAEDRPGSITLALPLSGRLQRSGEAIRDGFMAMYYEALSKANPIPAINIIDSQEKSSVDEIYQSALDAESDWVVGPLTKSKVTQLQQSDMLPLPTLALNYATNSISRTTLDDVTQDIERSPANLYQFGLAAEDEARQIADFAAERGLQKALVLLPRGDWGERIGAAFEQRWKSLGKQVVEVRYFGSVQDFNPDVKALLNVDGSQRRYRDIRSMVGGNVEFEPRRRQDADWVFLAALPLQARQIKPTLAFNFAADLPVYATSHIFSGDINPDRDRDLNGITFCDTPWLLRRPPLFDKVENTIGGQGSYARLYAMGVDAYRLVTRVKQLEVLPDSRIFGSTGVLQLDRQQRIVRKIDCSIFERGKPSLITTNE